MLDATCPVCSGKDVYHSQASSSYINVGSQFSVTYGSGYADGIYGQDTVTIFGSSPGENLIIPNVVFGQANEMDTQSIEGMQ